MAIIPGLMTADDLLRLPRGRARHELVRGELRTKPLRFIEEATLISTMSRSLGTMSVRIASEQPWLFADFSLKATRIRSAHPTWPLSGASACLCPDQSKDIIRVLRIWPSK